MLIYTVKFDKRKAAFAVVMAALVIIGVILLVGAFQKRGGAAAAGETAGGARSASVRSEKARVAYLMEQGWQVESPPESEGTVVIPRSFSPVFEDYNELQKRQGFDLSQYCGMEVGMYTYRVKNPEYAGDEVLAVLYVLNNRVIGGDVHSTALDGFMVGVAR
ncbi:MAG: DUF4830 domain-containing protein [Oscillospiraceae bacterium]|nr:DUF4830 domain-containing protein [Oscillospiraceae bacterium]